MIAGIVPHPTPDLSSSTPNTQALTSFLVLAYTPPDTAFLNEQTQDRAQQARKAADRPELRIISRAGEELAADAISITNFQSWGCNDYVLAGVSDAAEEARCYVVLSPRDVVVVKPRDRRDHVAWLVERKRYEEALAEVERIAASAGHEEADEVNASEIGQKYIEHLISEGE